MCAKNDGPPAVPAEAECNGYLPYDRGRGHAPLDSPKVDIPEWQVVVDELLNDGMAERIGCIVRVSVNAADPTRLCEGVIAIERSVENVGALFADDISATGRRHAYGLLVGARTAPVKSAILAAWPPDVLATFDVKTLRGTSVKAHAASIRRTVRYALHDWPAEYGRREICDVLVGGAFLAPWTRALTAHAATAGGGAGSRAPLLSAYPPAGSRSGAVGPIEALQQRPAATDGYAGQGPVVAPLVTRSAQRDWCCRQCGTPIDTRRRSDAIFCRRSACRVAFHRWLKRL